MAGLTGTLSVLATEPTGTHSTSNTSEFSTCMLSSPLPVDFLYLNAEKITESANSITWMTSSEKENDYFVVEKSKDGKDFTPIGNKIKGAGNSANISLYNLNDNHPYNGINYYRIAQYDFNGKNTYSRIVSVKNNNVSVGIYPNPTSDRLFIQSSGSDDTYTITIFDVTGKIHLTKGGLLNNDQETIFTDSFASGTYMLEYVSGDIRKMIKFIKQ